MNTRNRKTFVLGLGHQKCGTTWLYQYLCQSPQFAEGHRKESHVWDQLDIPLLGRGRAVASGAAVSIQDKMKTIPGYYYDYFHDLLSDGKSICADITPSYSGLKSERLAEIKRHFAARVMDVKAVVLVRDPLARIKSAVGFNLDRKNYAEGIERFETDFESALSQYYQTEHCRFRTQYQNILREAEKVFGAEEIYISFYETMFEKDAVLALSDFLQVEARPEFSKVRVNKTKSAVSATPIDDDVKAYYADTYEFFYKNFPITREIWA